MAFYSGPYEKFAVPGIILFSWTALVFLVLLALLFRSCCLVRKSTDPKKYKNKTNLYTVASIAFFSMTCMCVGGSIPLVLLSWNTSLLASVTGGVLWVIAQIMVYILLMIKLRDAFKGTKYESRKFTFYSLSLILFIFGGTQVLKLVFICNENPWLNPSGGTEQHPEVHSVLMLRMAICDGMMALIDIVISFLLVYLFSTKLMSIAVESVRNDGNIHLHYKSRQNQQELSLFINVVVKHTILTSTATVVTQIHILYWTMKNYYVSRSDDPEEWVYGALFECIMWPTQMLINSLCIIQYLPNETMYGKCHGCHAWCKLFFMQCARRRIQKEIEVQVGYHLMDSKAIELNNTYSSASGLWENPNRR